MQDRYAGDIGDFGKFALLRALEREGLSVGLNWYHTETAAYEQKQNDGRFKELQEYAALDEKIAAALMDVSAKPPRERTIAALEAHHLLESDLYYSKVLTAADRKSWHQNALDAMSGAELICLDPDNGLRVKSVGETSPKSIKYAFHSEVADYLGKGKAVMVYNHRCRKKPEKYFGDIAAMFRSAKKAEIFRGRELLAITFPRRSVRDYFFLGSPEQTARLKAALERFAADSWGQGQQPFCLIPEGFPLIL